MDPGVIFVLAVIAIILLIPFGLSWWTSNSKSYRAWEMKHLQQTIEELESRPSTCRFTTPL
jgi:hypothetical protein